MNANDRNRRIYEIHKAFPTWPFEDIGQMFGITRQRVQQIVREAEKRGIIDTEMEPRNDHRLNGKPISATQAARQTGIPYYAIEKWVRRGLVKVLNHPGHGGRGNPVLLDPVTLQERIDCYQPRPRRNRATI